MADEKLKKSWINKSKKLLEEALQSENETLFDTVLFGGWIGLFICREPIAFPDNEDLCVKTLRATRLKLCGYVYDTNRKVWLAEKDQEVNWDVNQRVKHI